MTVDEMTSSEAILHTFPSSTDTLEVSLEINCTSSSTFVVVLVGVLADGVEKLRFEELLLRVEGLVLRLGPIIWWLIDKKMKIGEFGIKWLIFYPKMSLGMSIPHNSRIFVLFLMK